MTNRRTVHLSSAILAFILPSTPAQAAGDADEKTQCLAASDRGQELQDQGAYLRAAEAFARCARESCPVLVQRDCATWEVNLEEKIPTVVFGATDSKGSDLEAVTVSVDGAQLVTRLDGKPTRVDPGRHVFRYEAADLAPVEARVVIRAGEKNRAVSIQSGASTDAPKPADASTAQEAKPRLPVQEDSVAPATPRPPLTAWILSGVALATVGSGAYFGISALRQRSNDLGPSGCAPSCSPSEVSSIRTKLAVADVSIGVGLVAAGAAAYFFLRKPSGDPPRDGFLLGLQPGGGLAAVRGAF